MPAGDGVTDSLKKLVRQRMKETGESYQAAWNALNDERRAAEHDKARREQAARSSEVST